MAEPSQWRRRLKRLALGAAIGGALVALAFFCLPLPIGWAINLAAKRALPPELELQARVGSGTFRWRLGHDTARVEISGIVANVKGHPLASVSGIEIEIDKGAVWHGYYAPRLVAITAPQLVVDSTAEGAFAALQSAKSSGPPRAPAAAELPALMTFSPALPAPGRECRLRVENLRVDYIFPGAKFSVTGGVGATLARKGDDLHAEAAANLGTREHPIAGTAKADVSLRTGKIGFTFSLPEFRTADLPPLPTGKLPIEGTIAFAAAGEADYATRTLASGSVDFSFRDGQLTVPGLAGPPIALERIALRAKATRREGALWGELEQGALVIDGATINLRKFEAAIAPRSRVTWEASVTDFAGTRLAPRLPGLVRELAPWLPRTLHESRLAEFSSKGAAVINRDAAGTLAVQELDATQNVRLMLADETLALEFSAHQRNGAPIDASVRVAPFEPRKLARAFPADWPIAAAAFPIGLEARAHASPTGELIDADARVEIGAGELRAVAPLPMAVPIRRFVVEARVREKGARVELPLLIADTALGQFELSNVALRHDPLNASVSGRAVVSGVELASFEKLVPVSALAPLRDAGLSLVDFGLRKCAVDFSADFKTKTGADWQPAKGSAAADIEAGFAGKPIVLQVTANLPEGATEATARVTMKEFRPSDFGPRKVAGVDLADFRFPITLETDARLSVRDAQLRSAALRMHVGPGEAQVAALQTSLPFRGVTVEADFDPQKNVARILSGKLQLAPGIEAGVEQVTIALAPKLRITGTAKLAPLALRDTIAWWPEKLLPVVRAQAAAALLAGKLQTDGIKFEIAAAGDKDALVPVSVRGSVALLGLSTRPPGVPGAVDVEETRIALDYPRAELQVKGARAPGFLLETASAGIADVMAARPTATAQATVVIDASAAKPWLDTLPPSPAISSAAQSTGKIRAHFSASAPVDATDFSGTKVTVSIGTEKLFVPGMFDGPLQMTFDAAAPTRTALTVGATLTLGDAKLMAMERRPNISPVTISLTLRDWLTAEAPVAELSLAATDVAGLPLRLKASAQLANRGQTLTSAELREFVFGRTELTGAWRRVAADHDAIAVSGSRIDVGELMAVAAPWMNLIMPPAPAAITPAVKPVTGPARATVPAARPSPVAVVAPPRPITAAPAAAASIAKIDLKFDVAEVMFGQARSLHALVAEAKLENNWPRSARLSATEGERNLVALELTPEGERQRVKIGVADTAALMRTLTEPLRTTPLPPGNIADTAKSARDIPLLIAGGTIGIEGELWRQTSGAEGISAKGNFVLTDATMISAPRVLQLLALRSGKNLERTPLIRKLSVGEWAFDPEQVAVKTFALEGSGLIDRVKLNSVRYAFAGEKLAVDGEYFGIGFEVIGTTSDPQVFLKENKVIRAIGQRNEFDVFFDDQAPAKKK